MEELRGILAFVRREEKRRKTLEAALFMSSRPMKSEELTEILNCDGTALRRLLAELILDYKSRDSGITVYANEELDEYHLRVKRKYMEKVKHLATRSEFNFGTQRTLALIAVKEPVDQINVIKYRNNKAYDHIKELEKKGFISREKKGRTFSLRTTKKFLSYFGKVRLKADRKEEAA